MATGVEAKISDALMAEVAAFASGTGYSVAYDGVNFTPIDGQAYLRCHVIKNGYFGPTPIAYTNTRTHMGMLQVSVMWPEGQGIVAPAEVVQSVIDHFVAGKRISQNGTQVRVTGTPEVADGIQETGWLNTPVTIPWRYHPSA